MTSEEIDIAAETAWRVCLLPFIQDVLTSSAEGLASVVTGPASEAERRQYLDRLRYYMLHAMVRAASAEYYLARGASPPTVERLIQWSDLQRFSATANPLPPLEGSTDAPGRV